MSELNLIRQVHCLNTKYCRYTDGFIDGYAIGIFGIIMFIAMYELVIIINNRYLPKLDEDRKND